jgi:hypothetical protein
VRHRSSEDFSVAVNFQVPREAVFLIAAVRQFRDHQIDSKTGTPVTYTKMKACGFSNATWLAICLAVVVPEAKTAPGLTVTLSVAKTTVRVGDRINITMMASNTGDVVLIGVHPADWFLGQYGRGWARRASPVTPNAAALIPRQDRSFWNNFLRA